MHSIHVCFVISERCVGYSENGSGFVIMHNYLDHKKYKLDTEATLNIP